MESADYIRARVENLERRADKTEREIDALNEIATEVRLLRKTLDRFVSLGFTVAGVVLGAAALALIFGSPAT